MSDAPDAPTKANVTIPDVAREAGVSTATAARALGDYGAVSKRAKEQVLDAARALGYRRNELARTMITGRSNTIALLIADIDNPFFAGLTRGVSAAARDAGYELVLTTTDEDLEIERSSTRVLLSKRVDGIIVAPAMATESEHLQVAQRNGCPVVLVDRFIADFPADVVTVDNRAASRDVTARLIAAGHERIAMVTGAQDPDSPLAESHVVTAGLDRVRGFHDAIEEAGLGDKATLRTRALDPESAKAMTLDLLEADSTPTAIYASDSRVAIGVYQALRSTGHDIPADISLVCFDDADWTSLVTPPLSVVAQPVVDLGRRTCQLLLERIAGDTRPPSVETLTTRFVSRDSIAAPLA